MRKPPFIHWFAYFDEEEPSVRYRAMYALRWMNQVHGVKHSLFLPKRGLRAYLTFFRTYFSALLFRKRRSVIVIQKVHTRGYYAAALKLLVRLRPARTVYDTDDADYLRFPNQNIHWFMRRCALVTAGSEAIRSYAESLGANTIFLTSPVISHSLTSTGQRSSPFAVGWIGYYEAHRHSLRELLFPAIAALPFPVSLLLLGIEHDAEEEEIREWFASHGHVDLSLPRAPDWQNEEAIYATISRCDVGVAPLLDTGMNRAKSAFKLKQFLSCGVPVLASPVGENVRFIHSGKNGELCATPDDFEAALKMIQAMPGEAYRDLCGRAHSSRAQFSMEEYCERFLKAFG